MFHGTRKWRPRGGYDIYQYDHTISKLPENNEKFHWQKYGVTGENETSELKSLETLIKLNRHENVTGMVLKMDIEGHEWAVLKNCNLKTLQQFDQIIVEMHGLLVPQNTKLIIEVLEKLEKTHEVIHVHGNNNEMVNFSNDLLTPNVIEVTFMLKGKYKTAQSSKMLPILLDEPCDRRMPDIFLGKW